MVQGSSYFFKVSFASDLEKRSCPQQDKGLSLKICSNFVRSIVKENLFEFALELVKAEPLPKPDPFRKEEVLPILDGFETSRYYSSYTNFVMFLFFSGARISEVIGLQWQHIASDYSTITFKEYITRGERKTTKTGETRIFPYNGKIIDFLQTIKPEKCKGTDLIFPIPKNKAINDHNFPKKPWKKVLDKVGVRHRVPYNCRHTFISQMRLLEQRVMAVGRYSNFKDFN